MVLMSSVASAGWKDFLPTSYDNGAEIRFFASWESDENEIGTRKQNWDDTFLKEKFALHTYGYSYEPRFIQYRLELSGALKQENYSSSLNDDTGWTNRTGVEYNARIFVLPEKPYNLELFAFRLEPLFRERSSTQTDNVDKSKGALFRYRKKPYFLDAKFIDDSIRSNFTESRVRTLGAGGNYFKQFKGARLFSLSGNYDHRSFQNSQGLDGNTDEFYVTNILRNNNLSLSSNLTKSDFSQDDRPGRALESNTFSILELLTAYLPWGFRTDTEYRYQKNTNDTAVGENLSKRNTAQFSLNHTLYESLYSRYTFRYEKNDSTSGESTNRSQFGNVNYTKRTPIGILLASIDGGRSNTNSIGETSAVNEPHSGVQVPGSFLLNETQQIDSLSIQVFLKSPLPPNDLILLQENVHYTVHSEGNTFRIDLFSLPPQFAIPETYDFVVTYNLSTGTFEVQTDTFGYSFSFDFWRMLRPYHSYIRSNPEVVSGALPGFLFDSSTTTTGIVFHRSSFQVLGEYQKLDWDVSPFHGWRFEATYSGYLTRTINVTASAEYLNKDFPQGSSLQNDQPFREERTILSGRIQKDLFSRTLHLTGGGSYSKYNTLTKGDAYTLNGSITWATTKLDFTLGASAFQWNATGFNGPDQKRFHQYYYLNVGRKLF
jgi:hypothetical protein